MTPGGTLTVTFFGTLAGLAGGTVHGILRRFVSNAYLRNVVFLLICVAVTWRAVNALLPGPRMLFVALTVAYVVAVELMAAKWERAGEGGMPVGP